MRSLKEMSGPRAPSNVLEELIEVGPLSDGPRREQKRYQVVDIIMAPLPMCIPCLIKHVCLCLCVYSCIIFVFVGGTGR